MQFGSRITSSNGVSDRDRARDRVDKERDRNRQTERDLSGVSSLDMNRDGFRHVLEERLLVQRVLWLCALRSMYKYKYRYMRRPRQSVPVQESQK
jgi:hypothetical protein